MLGAGGTEGSSTGAAALISLDTLAMDFGGGDGGGSCAGGGDLLDLALAVATPTATTVELELEKAEATLTPPLAISPGPVDTPAPVEDAAWHEV